MKTWMKKNLICLLLLFGAFSFVVGADEPAAGSLADLLSKIESDEVDVRYAARTLAPKLGAAAVIPLGELIVHKKRESALTARAALERIVHHAGRAGGNVEREAVTAELAKLLGSGRPAPILREALHLIALIGGDGAVASVSPLLDHSDATVQEAARLALERIPGKASIAALLWAAKTLPGLRRVEIIYSLSKKGDLSVAKDLAGIAKAGAPELKVAAIEALARLGALEAGELIAAEIAKAPETERGRLFDEYLRLADQIRVSHASQAEAIYRRAFAEAPLEHQRERALVAACPPASMASLPLLVAGTGNGSHRIRRAAINRLDELKGPEVFTALEKAYASSAAGGKPFLLQALAARDAAAAKPIIERASGDSNVDLKIAALDLLDKLDDPKLEPVYLRVAESGQDWLRPVAIKGYLLLARQKLASGAKADALPMFGKVLDLARDGGQRLDALRGLVEADDTRQLARVEGLVQDPQVGLEAARGVVKLAATLGKGGDLPGAEIRLMKIVSGDFPRELKGRAVDEMKALGLDPQRRAHREGFVVDWWVVTPLPNGDGKGLERKDFPEEVVELDKEHRVGERRFRWQQISEVTIDGRVNLVPFFRRGENVVTYAYTELESAGARDALFKMGSDDGIACWLNGERLHLNNASRGLKIDEDVVKARLKEGKNKLLLKISQTDGAWEFAFRITDPEGKPIDPTSLAGKPGGTGSE